MIDFEVREKDVVVKTEGERFYIPKDILETIYEDAQKEWYYKQDVVDYLKSITTTHCWQKESLRLSMSLLIFMQA